MRAGLRLGARQPLCTRPHATESKAKAKQDKQDKQDKHDKQDKQDKQDKTKAETRTEQAQAQAQAAASRRHPPKTPYTLGAQLARTETQQGTTAANDEQQGTARNKHKPLPAGSIFSRLLAPSVHNQQEQKPARDNCGKRRTTRNNGEQQGTSRTVQSVASRQHPPKTPLLRHPPGHCTRPWRLLVKQPLAF